MESLGRSDVAIYRTGHGSRRQFFFDDNIDPTSARAAQLSTLEQTSEPAPGHSRRTPTYYRTFTTTQLRELPGGLQVARRKGEWNRLETDPRARW